MEELLRLWDETAFSGGLVPGMSTTPLASFQGMLALTAGMIAVTIAVERYMAVARTNKQTGVKNGFGWARRMGTFNNAFYGVMICPMLCLASLHALQGEHEAAPIFDTLWCKSDPGIGIPGHVAAEASQVMYAYYLSKLWEFLDIVFVTLMGGDVAWQFKFHHWTTLSVAWVSAHYGLGNVLATCFVNAFHHIGMYLFFAGVRQTKLMLLFTGTLQLLLGIGCAVGSLYQRFSLKAPCAGSLEAEVYLLAIYFAYMLFWVQDLYVAFTSAGPEAAPKNGKKAKKKRA